MSRIRRLVAVIRWVVILLLMTITVNGWRVVFKVSRSGDVSPANSMLELWLGSDVVNDNLAGFYNTNGSYFAPFQPTYKSKIVNDWEQENVKYVKVGLYKDGVEKFTVVFNGTDANKTTFFDSTRILLSSSTDLKSRQLPFSLQGSYEEGRFRASENSGSCLISKGWFTVIDKDIIRYCGAATNDTPYFIYTPTGASTIIKDGEVGNAFAIFVDDCVENPCQHDGSCTSLINGYSCQCVDQVYGHSCQYNCPCHYGGKCHTISSGDIQSDGRVVINGTFINDMAITFEDGSQTACKCPQYYTGANCNTSTLQCASNPCLNYGSCIEEYTKYTCQCNEDYTGDRCEVVRPHPVESGLNTGAKAAIGVCVPLVILIGLAIAYIVYLFRNPEAYEATQKQYAIAREFVRRSMRRISGRRPKQQSDDTRDKVAISPKEKEVHTGQVNLAFDDGGKASYGRQNSEYYNMNANDNAIMSGQTSKYPVSNGNISEGNRQNYPHSNSRGNTPNRNEFYKDYQPAELIGGNSDQYSNPGQMYDEYNKLDQPDLIAPPRKQRQTGRRGRQENSTTHNDSKNYQNTQVPYSPKFPGNTPQGVNKGGYDGNILPMAPKDKSYDQDRHQTPPPRYESPQMQDAYKQPLEGRLPQTDRRLSPQQLDYERSNKNSKDRYADHHDPQGYRRPQQDVSRSPDDSRGSYENYRQPRSAENRTPRDSRHPQEYREQHTPTKPYGDSQRHGSDDRYQENYSPRGQNQGQRSPGYQIDRSPYDRYNRHPQETTTDNSIVFTSSEPMDDVTV